MINIENSLSADNLDRAYLWYLLSRDYLIYILQLAHHIDALAQDCSNPSVLAPDSFILIILVTLLLL